ncbi:MAG: outer membrane protein assembly factor BamC [Gammaproteobacteria bacterium]|nr:outer membrane protein assembly factor BamC [Gammaproteobacteria bacterium]MDH3446573.1 outer membrane protein assembly factor BamC [Gammaproteobacteria bacterium]
MRDIQAAALLVLAALIAGCQSDLDQRYLEVTLEKRLELPPDLVADEVESGFELPDGISGDDDSVRDRIPVLAKVDSIRLEGSAGLYWLSVEEPIENLYQQVKNFWASEGYRLSIEEPVIGVMQTEWVFRKVGTNDESGGWLSRLFGNDDLSASQDQFRTRIERGEQGRNRIYIVHRGTEYVYVFEGEDRSVTEFEDEDNQWRFRQPEPELEIEMLSRLMIYLGLQRSQVEQQLASAKLFKPRAFLQFDTEERSPFLILKDSYQIAWNRVYHELERLNFSIVSADFNTGIGFGQEGVITVATEVIESAGDGGFFSFFGSSDQKRQKKLTLVLSEESHELTRVDIENEQGDLDTTPEGAEFLKLLYQQIR